MEFRRSIKDTLHLARFVRVHHVKVSLLRFEKIMGRNLNLVSPTQIIFDSFLSIDSLNEDLR